jgi:hypothetical protein
MTGPDIQAAYFSPFHFILYMILIFGIMVIYYQWQWTKRCTRDVRVLVVQPDGSTETEYAPKAGNYVSLKIPESNSVRLWPINKLSSVEMLYPGDGFIPKFLQKKIKTVIVDAEDWEPLLNRGSYAHNVASPDVVRVIRDLADDCPDVAGDLNELADGLSTTPTRDLVASPAVLGNIMKEKVSELALTISRDTYDKMEGLSRKLDKVPNSLVLYIGLAAAVGVSVFVLISQLTSLAALQADIDLIKGTLGVLGGP